MDKRLFMLGLVAVVGVTMLFVNLESSDSFPQQSAGDFAAFRATYGKKYSSLAETEYRLTVFRANLRLINSHNADPARTYTLGLNQFADLTYEEFSSYYLSPSGHGSPEAKEVHDYPIYRSAAATRLDWRDKISLGPVKFQGTCRAGYAFASTFVVAAAYAIHKNEPIPSFSEQEIIDCTHEYGNKWCEGGLLIASLRFITHRNITLETLYPYAGKKQECDRKAIWTGVHRLSNYGILEEGPRQMLGALHNQPVAAGMFVSEGFQFYKSGVYDGKDCTFPHNHNVNLIGFDLEAALPYYIGRNSWGEDWGQAGYFQIALREKSGTCNITAGFASFIPIL